VLAALSASAAAICRFAALQAASAAATNAGDAHSATASAVCSCAAVSLRTGLHSEGLTCDSRAVNAACPPVQATALR